MGQIFNRIKNIAKSRKINDDFLNEFAGIDIDDDDDLKKAIDDAANNSEADMNVDTKYTKMDKETALQILGLDVTADIDKIKQAYKQKIKEYHPDKVASLGADLQSLAIKKTQEINLAFEYLKNEFMR